MILFLIDKNGFFRKILACKQNSCYLRRKVIAFNITLAYNVTLHHYIATLHYNIILNYLRRKIASSRDCRRDLIWLQFLKFTVWSDCFKVYFIELVMVDVTVKWIKPLIWIFFWLSLEYWKKNKWNFLQVTSSWTDAVVWLYRRHFL